MTILIFPRTLNPSSYSDLSDASTAAELRFELFSWALLLLRIGTERSCEVPYKRIAILLSDLLGSLIFAKKSIYASCIRKLDNLFRHVRFWTAVLVFKFNYH